jgi:hypothetical protein
MCLLWGMNWASISQKTATFIMTAVNISNLTDLKYDWNILLRTVLLQSWQCIFGSSNSRNFHCHLRSAILLRRAAHHRFSSTTSLPLRIDLKSSHSFGLPYARISTVMPLWSFLETSWPQTCGRLQDRTSWTVMCSSVSGKERARKKYLVRPSVRLSIRILQ